MAAPTVRVSDRRLLAAPGHLIVLLLIILAASGYNLYKLRRPAASDAQTAHAMARACAVTIAEQWLIVVYVWVGIRLRGGRMRDLTGGRWKDWKQVAMDFLIAAVFWGLWSGSAELFWWLIGPPHTRGGGPFHFPPAGAIEVSLWLLLSATAGFCEELIYRGYLQRQFQALTGSATVALLAQAVLFGIGHIYQGYKPVLVIALLGLEYGLLAYWRRNLRSAMLSHAWSDMVSGYFKYLWGW